MPFGIPSKDLCIVCGGIKDNQSHLSHGYTVCLDHQHLSLEEIEKYQKQKPVICDWCGAPGKVIGKSYGSLKVYHCTKCHHEWEG